MKKILLLIFLFLLTSTPSYAILIEGDLINPNDKLLTIDTETNLEWLDLPLTRGQSYASIIGGYGQYVTNYGFRYATDVELIDMYNRNGVTVIGSWDASNYIGAINILDLMGTSNVATIISTWGVTIDDSDSSAFFRFGLQAHTTDHTALFVNNGSGWPDAASEHRYASFLVRSNPIPEPSTVFLLSLGFIGAFIKRRRA